MSWPVRLTAWMKASRLTSQSYIFLPLLFGQACYFHMSQKIDWFLFLLLHLFGLCNQLYIVYANDYADRETDQHNKTFNMFSGGSRVLIDGDLSPSQLKNGAFLMAGLCLLFGAVVTLAYERWLAIPIVLFALSLLWAYSYPPLKVSYRGGGEILQMIGVGIVLPSLAFYVQAGTLVGMPWYLLIALLPSQLACAMSTSLPDEPSDRSSGKKTSTVLLGAEFTKLLIFILNLLTVLMVPIFSGLGIGSNLSMTVIGFPLLAALGLLIFIRSKPGTGKLVVFNILSVFAILSVQTALSIVFFFGFA